MTDITRLFGKIQEVEHIRLSKDPFFSVNAAKANRTLNRYSNILPFDYNRVVLPNNEYVNASYMTSLYGNERYIASQGPTPSTIGHFWKMIWNENSRLIVMLTPLKEDRVKCDKYWPDQGGTLEFEQPAGPVVSADLNSEVVESPCLTKRTFTLRSGSSGENRTIQMLHFEGWPDHSESDLNSVLDLIKLANQVQNECISSASLSSSSKAIGPMVVHCSAGVGRTGTFCSIDGIQKDTAAGLKPGPYQTAKSPSFVGEVAQFPANDLVAQTVNHLRRLRVSSVQSISQFKMIYQALALK